MCCHFTSEIKSIRDLCEKDEKLVRRFSLTHLVIVGRVLRCKFQLSNDDLVRPHPRAAHALQDCLEVDVVESLGCSANQS